MLFHSDSRVALVPLGLSFPSIALEFVGYQNHLVFVGARLPWHSSATVGVVSSAVRLALGTFLRKHFVGLVHVTCGLILVFMVAGLGCIPLIEVVVIKTDFVKSGDLLGVIGEVLGMVKLLQRRLGL